MELSSKHYKIAIIGLGYVGLPLAVAFAKKFSVVGFDIDENRLLELGSFNDHTQEIFGEELKSVLNEDPEKTGLYLTKYEDDLKLCNIYIVTVPTPITKFKTPDLSFLQEASRLVGKYIKPGDIIIYESTVYPGCTEEECVPVLEQSSGLKFNQDFFCGYSPERINPGDKINTLTRIKKVTSGSTPEIAEEIDLLYNSIIEAGTYKAPSIKVAEASKAIENAQRDLNISFVNELALIFDRMGIDTNDVLEAASTKWNFLKFKPGLVGGHCISVDPYYLLHKAQMLGYNPQVILSGRNVNDSMGAFVAQKVVKLMIKRDIKINKSKVLILGFTFKENCSDTRNTKIIDIYNELISFGTSVDIYDPWADIEKIKQDYNIQLLTAVDQEIHYDAIILTVAHEEFLHFDFAKYREQGSVIFDTKSFVNRKFVDGRL